MGGLTRVFGSSAAMFCSNVLLVPSTGCIILHGKHGILGAKVASLGHKCWRGGYWVECHTGQLLYLNGIRKESRVREAVFFFAGGLDWSFYAADPSP